MILKLYLIIDNKDVAVLPGQIEGFKELANVVIKIPDEVKATLTTPLPVKCQVLANVDIQKEEVVEILEVFAANDLISRAQLQAIKKENEATLSNQEARKMKYEIPHDFFIEEINWGLLTTGIDLGKYPLLIGPKGCGKSKCAQSIAKAMNLNYFPINCGAIFKPKQTLVGTIQAKEGSTYLVNSEFLKHFTSEDPTLIFLDEVSRIPQGASNYFMTILDRIQSYLYIEEEGRRVQKGSNVHFIGAGNFGFEYSDTRNLDGAFIDRFTKIMIDYLPEEEEIKLIMQMVPGSNPSNVKSLVQNANICREEKEKLRVAISTRQLIDMAEYMVAGFTFHEIKEHIFINLFVNGSMDERDTVTKMLDGVS